MKIFQFQHLLSQNGLRSIPSQISAIICNKMSRSVETLRSRDFIVRFRSNTTFIYSNATRQFHFYFTFEVGFRLVVLYKLTNYNNLSHSA